MRRNNACALYAPLHFCHRPNLEREGGSNRKATDMPGLKCILLTSILSLNCIVPIAAGPLEDGLAAYHKGEYATALSPLRPLADQGLADVQNTLGVMYANGQGVPQSYVGR